MRGGRGEEKTYDVGLNISLNVKMPRILQLPLRSLPHMRKRAEDIIHIDQGLLPLSWPRKGAEQAETDYRSDTKFEITLNFIRCMPPKQQALSRCHSVGCGQVEKTALRRGYGYYTSDSRLKQNRLELDYAVRIGSIVVKYRIDGA